MTGRTTYKPEYCEAIVDHCAQGGSIQSFAGVVGVSKQTLYNWKSANAEFAEACEIAISKATFEDEKLLDAVVKNGDAKKQLGALIYRLGNRAPDVWRNVQRTELTGADGGPIDHNTKTTVDVSRLTDEQIAVLASIHAG